MFKINNNSQKKFKFDILKTVQNLKIKKTPEYKYNILIIVLNFKIKKIKNKKKS